MRRIVIFFCLFQSFFLIIFSLRCCCTRFSTNSFQGSWRVEVFFYLPTTLLIVLVNPGAATRAMLYKPLRAVDCSTLSLTLPVVHRKFNLLLPVFRFCYILEFLPVYSCYEVGYMVLVAAPAYCHLPLLSPTVTKKHTFHLAPPLSSSVSIMVLSSYAALNKIEAGGIRELNMFISQTLDSSVEPADVVKPIGLHFCVGEKIFIGTTHPLLTCPIEFLLHDRISHDTLLCRPIWTESCQRSKVNRKARVGVKKHSVIRLDDFSVVAHDKAKYGHVFFVKSYQVVKKDVDDDAYERWITD
jgi:hypothetical protein